MITNGIQFELIYQGSNIMTVTIHSKLNMRLIDTLNVFPMGLAKLPKAFGFSGQKGDFPHFVNLPENQSYVGEFKYQFIMMNLFIHVYIFSFRSWCIFFTVSFQVPTILLRS